MNDKKYKWIVYFITCTIIITIAVQAFWNYNNYLVNKQNFTNQVQSSFDNATDKYYASIASHINSTKHIRNEDSLFANFESSYGFIDSIITNIHSFGNKNIVKNKTSSKKLIITNYEIDTEISDQSSITKIINKVNPFDSLDMMADIKMMFLSIQNDTLNLTQMGAFLKNEFDRKNFNIPFALEWYVDDEVLDSYTNKKLDKDYLTTTSKSTFLNPNEKLLLNFSNITYLILQKSFLGILLSLLLSIAIIACLYYLLQIIKQQKQLSEMKNDLISNITHEFKTPIATIGVAIEGIRNFNTKNDPEKTNRYLDISSNHLIKLNTMVEKLLETASLDSDNLHLKMEPVDINNLLFQLIKRQEIRNEHKPIKFNPLPEEITLFVDKFHMENAIANILDNALKYGGSIIELILVKNSKHITIEIIDNGNSLKESQADLIFQQFYRVEKGNTHNVKGYGIGLYYSKNIIEKHHGTIKVILNPSSTNFKIAIPYE